LKRRTKKQAKTAGQRHREAASRSAAKASAAVQEIGPLPKPECTDRKRRRAAEKSLQVFLETYFPDLFFLPWSDDHLQTIVALERAATHGGLLALAMPRGGGKSSLCRGAALWCVLTGRRRYVCLIAGTATRAEELVKALKITLRTNQRLYVDFKRELHAIRALDGEPRRCRGQRYRGKPTYVEWGASHVVFPTIPGSKASGSVISGIGLTGSEIRGRSHTLADGQTVLRPDFCLIDDPQNRETAASPTENRKRLQLLNGDVLGMAGPTATMAAVATVTVIYPDDLADRLLNRERSPQWSGERFRMVYQWPDADAMELWRQYGDIWQDKHCREAGEHTEFYRQHHEAMDRGAVVAWPERHEASEISALQCAMNKKLADPEMFAAEYQNEPLEGDGDMLVLRTDQVAAKVNHQPRLAVPTDCEHVTAFIDCHQKLLYWLAVAWESNFTGYVIDRGTVPDQRRRHFTMAGAPRPFPGRDVEAEVYGGLKGIVWELAQRKWWRDDGAMLRISRIGIDSGWQKATVYRYAKQQLYGNLVWPSKGVGITAGNRPMSEYRRKPGETIGDNWYVPSVRGTREPRHVVIDTNHWKSFCYQLLAAPMGSRGCLSLWGSEPALHRLFAEHICDSEYRVQTEGRGRKVEEWKQRASRPDNHWLDCLVGCAVTASMLGCRLADTTQPAATKRRRKRRVQYLD